MGASRKQKKAAVEALIVESNISNPAGGDRDSQGPFQQRASQGWKNPRNVRVAARQFFEHAKGADKGQSSGALAQDVQRSAFPGRYNQVAGQAGAILRGSGGGRAASAARTITTGDPDARRAALQNYLNFSHDPDALLNLAHSLENATKTRTISSPGSSLAEGGDKVTRVKARADRINQAHPSYSWGGGHGGKPAKLGTPVDCSGAVSQVLGVNPRVSGQFAKWGKPGAGKRITVYANGHHVFMEIDGHFFGTSGSNKGGGAGWIPRSQISPDYLRGFTARHPAGQ